MLRFCPLFYFSASQHIVIPEMSEGKLKRKNNHVKDNQSTIRYSRKKGKEAKLEKEH